MSFPKMAIEPMTGGYVVKAEIVKDAGDGVPWPYNHEQIVTTVDDLVALVRHVFEEKSEALPLADCGGATDA